VPQILLRVVIDLPAARVFHYSLRLFFTLYTPVLL
jgi:hypothetical protein